MAHVREQSKRTLQGTDSLVLPFFNLSQPKKARWYREETTLMLPKFMVESVVEMLLLMLR